MPDLAELQQRLAPLFPGLMGVTLRALAEDRVLAELMVRPELCTTGGILHGGAVMAFADTLGAIGTVLNLPAGKRTTTTDSST
jgi:1,4-dihydroxy-2-naphthoyl-CoA hydrolase